jgi:hypothetical protein
MNQTSVNQFDGDAFANTMYQTDFDVNCVGENCSLTQMDLPEFPECEVLF